jgi:hypothetical protein
MLISRLCRYHGGDTCFDKSRKVAARELKAPDPGGAGGLKIGHIVPYQKAS